MSTPGAGRGAWQEPKLYGWKGQGALCLLCHCGMLQDITNSGPRATLAEGVGTAACAGLHGAVTCPGATSCALWRASTCLLVRAAVLWLAGASN